MAQMVPLEDRKPSDIKGNATEEEKESLLNLQRAINYNPGYGVKLMSGARIVEVNHVPPISGKKPQAVVECEIDVEQDMCNGWSVMHGGCTATLLDFCTSLPIPIIMHDDEWSHSGLTLSLTVNYFIPALPGETLRVIATTKAGGKRSVTVGGEMWSSRGLVATCTHIKMVPSTVAKL